MANQVVYGIIQNRQKAEAVIQALVDMGVNPNDISFLSPQGDEFRDFSAPEAAGAGRNWRTEERVTKEAKAGKEKGQAAQAKPEAGAEKRAKASEAAAAGATKGGIIGGALGLLAGLGALAIPGLGPFVAAGPIMGALSGLGAGGAVGGILGALTGAGVSENEAKLYENRLKEGAILLAVRASSDDLAKRIQDLLEHEGAEDVAISAAAALSKKAKK